MSLESRIEYLEKQLSRHSGEILKIREEDLPPLKTFHATHAGEERGAKRNANWLFWLVTAAVSAVVGMSYVSYHQGTDNSVQISAIRATQEEMREQGKDMRAQLQYLTNHFLKGDQDDKPNSSHRPSR